MSLTPSMLDAVLKKSAAADLDPFWLITGTEPFLMLEAADRLRREARERGYTDRQVLEMGGRSDWSELTMAAADVGMFNDKKVVDLRLPGGKPGTEGAKVLADYVQRPYEGVTTLLSIPRPDWSGVKAAWWQTLLKHCRVVECDAVERQQLPAWIGRRMQENGQSAEPAVLEEFADLVEGNLFAAHQEIQKLALLFPAGQLTDENIRSAVTNSSRFEMDTLFDCMDLGQGERVARIIDGLEAQNAPLPFLVVMFSAHIRNLLKLRAGRDAGQSFVPGVFAGAAMKRAAQRLTVRKLRNALMVCAEIDKLSKGIPVPERDTDPWIELKSVALFLSR